MDRTILVTVGISLVTDRLVDRELYNKEFRKLEGPYASLSDLRDGLLGADHDTTTPFTPDDHNWQNAQSGLANKLAELWRREENQLGAQFKRAWSGAELASLHLLGKEPQSDHAPLSATDRVFLLASDTPSGQVCAGVIAKTLRKGCLGVIPSLVDVIKVDGLRADDATLFLEQGLPNTAFQLAKHRRNSILIVSGGYKGLLPYLTPIANQLDLPMLYLYEESDTLLEIRSLDREHLRWVCEFRDAFNRIDRPNGVDYAVAFWAAVDNIHPTEGRLQVRTAGLISEDGDHVKLTPVGILACKLQPLLYPAK